MKPLSARSDRSFRRASCSDLVQRAAGRVEPLGEHVDRHPVEGQRDEHLALSRRQAAVDRIPDRVNQLASLGLALGARAGIRHHRPDVGVEHHLAVLPGPAAQAHPGFEQRELVGPGGEAARAAEVVELPQDGHECVIGCLQGQVVELLAAHVGERGTPARDLVAGGAQQQPVQPVDRLVALGSRPAQRVEPGAGVMLGAPGLAGGGADRQAEAHAGGEANSRGAHFL